MSEITGLITGIVTAIIVAIILYNVNTAVLPIIATEIHTQKSNLALSSNPIASIIGLLYDLIYFFADVRDEILLNLIYVFLELGSVGGIAAKIFDSQ